MMAAVWSLTCKSVHESVEPNLLAARGIVELQSRHSTDVYKRLWLSAVRHQPRALTTLFQASLTKRSTRQNRLQDKLFSLYNLSKTPKTGTLCEHLLGASQR